MAFFTRPDHVWEVSHRGRRFKNIRKFDKTEKTHFVAKVPYVLGLIATRSIDEQAGKRSQRSPCGKRGAHPKRQDRLRRLQKIRAGDRSSACRRVWLWPLLKKYTDDPARSPDELTQ